MSKQSSDPGFGRVLRGKYKRIINHDGSFNVVRVGGAEFSLGDTYQYLINLSWTKFLLLTFLLYCAFNALFAFVYVGIGIEDLSGCTPDKSSMPMPT